MKFNVHLILMGLFLLGLPFGGALAPKTAWAQTYRDSRLQAAETWARAQSSNSRVRYDWGSGSETYCQRFVEQAFGTRGNYASAIDAYWDFQDRGLMLDERQSGLVQPGVIVFFEANASNGYSGHSGIYIGNREMISVTDTGVRVANIDRWNDRVAPLLGFAAPPSDWPGR